MDDSIRSFPFSPQAVAAGEAIKQNTYNEVSACGEKHCMIIFPRMETHKFMFNCSDILIIWEYSTGFSLYPGIGYNGINKEILQYGMLKIPTC